MGIVPFLLLVLIGGVFTRTTNPCNRDISRMKNYMNIAVDVPLAKVVDVITAPVPFQIRYFPILSHTRFSFFASSCSNVTASEWSSSDNFWFARNVSYTRKIEGNPLFSESKTFEEQKVLYQERSMVMTKQVRTDDGIDVRIQVEYCATPGTTYETDVEVHINITVNSIIASLFEPIIKESAHKGFIETYGALSHMLHYLSNHKDMSDPIKSPLVPVEINAVLPNDYIELSSFVYDSSTPQILSSPSTNIPLEFEFSYVRTIIIGVIGVVFLSSLVVTFFHYYKKWEMTRERRMSAYSPRCSNIPILRDPQRSLRMSTVQEETNSQLLSELE